MIDIETWGKSETVIEKSRRSYAHFDCRTDIARCWDRISDPESIASHGFYPFIRFDKVMNKYSRGAGLVEKSRSICYAAHIDRCIFQLYSFILNQRYNEECAASRVENVAVAYRTNLGGQSNIDFANRAISSMRHSRECYVMIGDFTHFFDSLDHEYLKKQWCELLQEDRLPADHYAIYKNITAYSYVELSELLAFHDLPDTPKGWRELNAKARVLSPEEFRSKKKDVIQKNNKDHGIPQGSPISGILANVYMREADREIYNLVNRLNGLYMRYSDDFIVVLPGVDEKIARDVLTEIADSLNSDRYPGLELQPEKTQFYHFSEERIENCGESFHANADCSSRDCLSFLGFTFDGKKVKIRDKTISKFYQRMRKKARTVARSYGADDTGEKYRTKKVELYKTYSIRGSRRNGRIWGTKCKQEKVKARYEQENREAGRKRKPGGNFLTYVRRAQERFGPNEDIGIPERRNMAKIRKFLKEFADR